MIGKYINGTLDQLLIAHLEQLPAQRMTLVRLEETRRTTQGTINLLLLALGFPPAAGHAQTTTHRLHVLQVGFGCKVDSIICAQIWLIPGLVTPVG